MWRHVWVFCDKGDPEAQPYFGKGFLNPTKQYHKRVWHYTYHNS